MNTFALLARLIPSLACAFLLAACGTPGAPRPSHSSQVGPKAPSAKLDALPAWTDASEAKRALVAFVENAAIRGSGGYLAPADRVAIFDESVLWAEPPALVKVPGLTRAGITTEEFAAALRDWLRETQAGRVLCRQPVQEAFAYLAANGFKTYVVTSRDSAALRVLAAEVYGLSPERIVGPCAGGKYEVRSGGAVIVRGTPPAGDAPGMGKPVIVDNIIGRRPVIAFGAAGDDLALLEYTTLQNPLPSAAFIVRTARDAGQGASVKLRAEAAAQGWRVIETASDWAGCSGK